MFHQKSRVVGNPDYSFKTESRKTDPCMAESSLPGCIIIVSNGFASIEISASSIGTIHSYPKA
jgi:hypothetical protein